MSVLTEIKAYLDALGTLGTIDMGAMPASPDVLGCLYEYGGQTPEGRFGIDGIGFEKPSLQLVFRGAPGDYSGPRAKAEIAYRALATAGPGVIVSGSATYLWVWPQQPPHPVQPPDENKRHRIGVNFYAMKEPS